MDMTAFKLSLLHALGTLQRGQVLSSLNIRWQQQQLTGKTCIRLHNKQLKWMPWITGDVLLRSNRIFVRQNEHVRNEFSNLTWTLSSPACSHAYTLLTSFAKSAALESGTKPKGGTNERQMSVSVRCPYCPSSLIRVLCQTDVGHFFIQSLLFSTCNFAGESGIFVQGI